MMCLGVWLSRKPTKVYGEEQLLPCGVEINSGQLSDNLSFGCSQNNCVYSKHPDSTTRKALKLSSLSATHFNYRLWKASLSLRLKKQVIELNVFFSNVPED